MEAISFLITLKHLYRLRPQLDLGLFNEIEIIGLLQQTITWYMVAGKLVIIPALGHYNKET